MSFSDLKPDGLRNQLKVGKVYKFTKGPLITANKTKPGEMFKFEGKDFKMTPLMKKRITLAITLLKLPKATKSELNDFAKKNKGKSKPKNPIGGDALEWSTAEASRHGLLRQRQPHEQFLSVSHNRARNEDLYRDHSDNNIFVSPHNPHMASVLQGRAISVRERDAILHMGQGYGEHLREVEAEAAREAARQARRRRPQ